MLAAEQVASASHAPSPRSARVGRALKKVRRQARRLRAQQRFMRADQGVKRVSALQALRSREGVRVEVAGAWPGLSSAYYAEQFSGTEPIRDQRMRLARWESVAECRRFDAAEDPPCLDFSDFAEADQVAGGAGPGWGAPPSCWPLGG